MLCAGEMLSSGYMHDVSGTHVHTLFIRFSWLVMLSLHIYSFRSSMILQMAGLGWMCTMTAVREAVLGQSV